MSTRYEVYCLMQKRVFDWKPVFDSRSKDYAMRSLFFNRKIEEVPTFWEEGIVLDQGSEGACVGFAWTGELLAEPQSPQEQPSFDYANSLAISFYRQAQLVDQWPGEDYEGTSVLAGARIMKQKGFIGEYRWCFNIHDVKNALLTEGPVVIGIPWFSGMYDTDPNGVVRISGDLVGGHALVLTGYHPSLTIGNTTEKYFRWRNSWGPDYGNNGSGWIRFKDLEKLLRSNAEACVPMMRQVPIFEEPKVSFWKKLFNK